MTTRSMQFAVGGALLLMASSVNAGPKVNELAACMWEKMPTSTNAFVQNADKSNDFFLFMKAMAPCDMKNASLNLKGLKKVLIKSRPAVIAADKVKADNVFMCEKGADGKPSCKGAGQ